jgi:hypothetical protein
MRKTIRLMLLPLVACSTTQATAKPPEKTPAQATEVLLQVGPLVKSVVSGSKTLEPGGDFFRAVLANSEYDPCLRVERVNVRAPHAPTVQETRKYCAFTLGAEELKLAPEAAQEVEFSHLAWKGFDLSFALTYMAAVPGASAQELRCTLDPRQATNKIQCTLAPGTGSGE